MDGATLTRRCAAASPVGRGSVIRVPSPYKGRGLG